MKSRRISAFMIGMLFWLLSTNPGFTQGFDQVKIETIPVAPGIHMLVGQGGNICISSGDDGVFMIDDQYAPLTEKIKAAVAAVTSERIRFIINTHWHGDHTGGNENFGGEGVAIIAHENVRNAVESD